MKQLRALGILLFGAAACQDATAPDPINPRFGTPSFAAGSAHDYIVTFHADEADPDGAARALVAAHGGSITFVYRSALRGFAVAGLPDAAVEALVRNPRVAAVERDGVVGVAGSGTQTGATWGIDRIDQADLPLNGTYAYGADGSGVRVYIIDTGIRTSHNEFGGRASGGYTAINDGNGTNDCHGHGTHVAGTVGGSTYGVAQSALLVAVRVLGCSGSGSTSGVIAGVDWVTQHAVKPAVANMSLGGGASSSLDNAVNNSVASGVTYAVAAGNSNANACNYSPARAASALTVAATTSSDNKASYSNYGSCVDILAPGSSITSAWSTSNTATNTISGTSMASPHVAGAAAAYLELNPTHSPSQVASALIDNATPNTISGFTSTTPNRMLYVGFLGGTQPPGEDPPGDDPPSGDAPVASFTKSCSGFTCTFTAAEVGSNPTYSWDFGDGTTGSGRVVQKTFAARRNYTVTLVVTNDNGTGQATQTVSCNPRKCQ